MVLALLVAVCALLLGLATGGRWPAWSRLGLHGVRWLLAALALQLASAFVPGLPGAARPALLAGSFLLALVAVLANRRVPGAGLVGLGLAANGLVIALNAGMPVSLAAARRAGLDLSAAALAADPRHAVLDAGTRLPWLADVLPFPVPVLPEVVSAGDVLVAAGLGLAVLTAVRAGRPLRRPDARSAQPAARSTTRASASTTRGS
ncbi:MAG: DUF5317 domain-containing protein [Motilibacteraceae bacterium]